MLCSNRRWFMERHFRQKPKKHLAKYIENNIKTAPFSTGLFSFRISLQKIFAQISRQIRNIDAMLFHGITVADGD